MKCRRKPIELECWPVAKILTERKECPDWVKANFDDGLLFIDTINGDSDLRVRTREGWLTAYSDGYLIQGKEGQIWPVALVDFLAGYEPIEEPV